MKKYGCEFIDVKYVIPGEAPLSFTADKVMLGINDCGSFWLPKLIIRLYY